MDLGIILTGKDSTRKSEQIQFIKKILSKYTITQDKTRVAIIDIDFKKKLNEYITLKDMDSEVFSIISTKFGNKKSLKSSLKYARGKMFLPMNGARTEATKSLLILLDGEFDKKELELTMTVLRGKGIKTVVVAMGESVDPMELLTLVKPVSKLNHC